jgi:hypothetical protein
MFTKHEYVMARVGYDYRICRIKAIVDDGFLVTYITSKGKRESHYLASERVMHLNDYFSMQ